MAMAGRPVAGVGDVVLAVFPQHIPPGHEQEGPRPAVVVGLPDALGLVRFPLIVIVPLTRDQGQPWAARNPLVYPRLPAGTSGISVASLALLDQVRAVTVWRITRHLGTLSPSVYRPIQDGLHRIFEGNERDWRTKVGVTRNWSRQMAQASKELGDVADMIERDEP